MVKDDLEKFDKAFDVYVGCSNWKAIKEFFNGVPNPIFYGFRVGASAITIFASILAWALFTYASNDQKNYLLFTIMFSLGSITVFYFYLLKSHGLVKESKYQRLLTHTYYQYDRYQMFKGKLKEEYDKENFSIERLKEITQSRMQLDQGLSVFRTWILGFSASVFITIIYSMIPSDANLKVLYLAIVSFFVLVTLFYAYFVHDPFWFKGNKYREFVLFLTLFESDIKALESIEK